MYQTLYRKYRPSSFEEVVGQKVVIKTLKNSILNNKISHAYIFAGPRGTGKTSIAKILAKTVNCKNLDGTNPCNNCSSCIEFNDKKSIDIIEIDAASNNGVDEIRELKSKVNLVPSLGKYKVYIIDEVHMLTTGAFNALLKTLEEPPSHIIFILATTEPHKIPATILSRCQRFDFKKISDNDLIERMKVIIEKENIEIEENALIEIARLADGGMRDSLSILDQAISYCNDKIKLDDIYEINGIITKEKIRKIIEYINNKNIESLFSLINELNNDGKDFVKVSEEIILFLRDLILKNSVPEYFKENNYNIDIYDNINITNENLFQYTSIFNNAIKEMKVSSNPKIQFELVLIKLLNIEKNFNDNLNTNMENKIEAPSVKKNSKIENDIRSNEYIKKETDINSEIKKKNIFNIKNIRVNNTLCYFDKKELMKQKNNLLRINEMLLDPSYGEYASIVIDGELKAVGDKYMIFVYENERLSNLFNNEMVNIDKFLENILNKEVSATAVSKIEWEKIKNEYNSKLKKYIYMEEPKISEENIEKNQIEENFSDIIEYS